jgi:hypothetical protein
LCASTGPICCRSSIGSTTRSMLQAVSLMTLTRLCPDVLRSQSAFTSEHCVHVCMFAHLLGMLLCPRPRCKSITSHHQSVILLLIVLLLVYGLTADFRARGAVQSDVCQNRWIDPSSLLHMHATWRFDMPAL